MTTQTKGTVALFKAPEESIARADDPAMPAFIIQPKYQKEASVQLTELSRGRMFMHVAENSFNYSVLGDKGFKALGELIDQCQCYNFAYSQLDEAIDALESLINK